MKLIAAMSLGVVLTSVSAQAAAKCKVKQFAGTWVATSSDIAGLNDDFADSAMCVFQAKKNGGLDGGCVIFRSGDSVQVDLEGVLSLDGKGSSLCPIKLEMLVGGSPITAAATVSSDRKTAIGFLGTSSLGATSTWQMVR